MSDIPRLLEPLPKKITKNLKLRERTRRAQRRRVLEAWLKEEEHSRYTYCVEVCADKKIVYLRRPTWLNKGLDFQINLQGFKSRSNEAPRHKDITLDLRKKKRESLRGYKKLRNAIDEVYGCAEPDDVLRKRSKFHFKKGLPVDALLKVLKWLFIEQDLTYWNNSGRRMLMNAIKKVD